jgi:DNA-directed RNA polymerase subunit RPC12/RpoP
MMLTHVCPNCKKEHEMAVTPEPDHLCPECEEKLLWKNSARLVIDFDCGNCPMKKEEGQWLDRLIREECEKRGIKLEKVEWYGVD